MVNSFSKFMKHNILDIRKAQRIPSRINKTDKNQHVIVKLLKNKDKETILKASRVNRNTTYGGTTIRMIYNFS